MRPLSSNPARDAALARRLAAGQSVSPEVLAEALAVDEATAEGFLQLDLSGFTENELAASLAELALKDTP